MNKSTMSGRNGSAPDGDGVTVARVVGDAHLHLPSNSRLTCTEVAKTPAFNSAVFLDRDGVVVEEVGFIRTPSEIKLPPGVPEAIVTLQDRFFIIVVTNQSGIARGLFTEDDLLSIHSDMVRQLSTQGAIIDGLYYCPHHPEAPIPVYRTACQCRKPKPGMLLRAAADWGIDLQGSFLAGDQPGDVEAARAAGVRSIAIGNSFEPTLAPDLFAEDLAEAAGLILASSPPAEVTPTDQSSVAKSR